MTTNHNDRVMKKCSRDRRSRLQVRGISMLRDTRGASMAEAAIALPVMLLFLAFGLNVSHAGRTALAARDAADYGARVGAVARSNPERWAEDAAQASLQQAGAGGSFATAVEVLEWSPGHIVRVTVSWSHPTLFSALCPLFGKGCPANFTGAATAVWKREEW
jgi:Flp pilus assembly protein TadG